MSEIINFIKDEIDQINEFKKQYNNITLSLGQYCVEIQILRNQINELEKRRDELYNHLNQLTVKEKEFIQSLNKKYGDGILNLENGTFIKAEGK